MSTRRFEYVEGSSSKFWEIAVNGTTVTVRFGRIGTSGQTQTRSLESAASAKRHAEKQIGEKTRKGYREVQAVINGAERSPAAAATAPALYSA